METEKSDPDLKKSMNQFRRTIFILIAIVVLSAIIATAILFFKINSLHSEPFFKMISASKNTFTAYSARVDATLENPFKNRFSTLTGRYEVNPDSKKLTAEFDIISKPITSTSKKEDKINIKINCAGNGGKILYNQNDKTEIIDINEKNAENFFALFSETKDFSITNFNNDWQGLIDKMGWQDYVNAAVEKGPINTMPDIPGIAVWHQGHIGVYIGNGYVIHAANTYDGVIKTPITSSGWTHWLKVPYINYIEETEDNPN